MLPLKNLSESSRTVAAFCISLVLQSSCSALNFAARLAVCPIFASRRAEAPSARPNAGVPGLTGPDSFKSTDATRDELGRIPLIFSTLTSCQAAESLHPAWNREQDYPRMLLSAHFETVSSRVRSSRPWAGFRFCRERGLYSQHRTAIVKACPVKLGAEFL